MNYVRCVSSEQLVEKLNNFIGRIFVSLNSYVCQRCIIRANRAADGTNLAVIQENSENNFITSEYVYQNDNDLNTNEIVNDNTVIK